MLVGRLGKHNTRLFIGQQTKGRLRSFSRTFDAAPSHLLCQTEPSRIRFDDGG
jgi:hypothetical protein